MANQEHAGTEHRQRSPDVIFLWMITTLLIAWMTIRTAKHGADFKVFWMTARALLEGAPVYSVEQFGNMVFKYPPWILPAFLPLAVFPLGVAKVIWGLIQGACLLYTVIYLRSLNVRPWILSLMLLLFGGILMVHALVGQITLLMLTGFLLCRGFFIPGETKARGPFAFLMLTWVATLKIYTVFPLLGLRWRSLNAKHVFVAGAGLFALSLPVLVLSYEFSIQALFQDWMNAVFSGTHAIGSKKIGFATRELQGIPPLLMRIFGIAETDTGLMKILHLGSFAGVGLLWVWISRGLSPLGRFLGWLALTPVVQPLSWFHFFWMAFPLAALSVEKGLQSRRWVLFLAIFGTILATAVTAKTLGRPGLWLEYASVKTWGVFFILAAWIAQERIANHFRRC